MTKSTVVKFNVGGTINEVRKSLVDEFPSTVLARSVSEEWKNASGCEEPIFIERDAARFRYCFLDYMRGDKKVELPHTESKQAFLTDLEYLGFEHVDTRSITMDKIPLMEAANILMVSSFSL